MHPDAEKELRDLLDDVIAGRRPESDIPRLFYFGHTVINTFPPGRSARWKCLSCETEWVSEDGYTCPGCKLYKES